MLAFVVGSALTALGILLTTVSGAEWLSWAFLLPWALMGHSNTADKFMICRF